MKVSICYLKYRDHSTYSAVKNLDKVKLTSRLLNTWCCYCCTVLDEIEKRIIHFKKKNHSILKAKPVSRDLYNIEKLFTQLIFKHIFLSFLTSLQIWALLRQGMEILKYQNKICSHKISSGG